MFTKSMTFILLILIFANLYCIYRLTKPEKNSAKINIDFQQAYYEIKCSKFKIDLKRAYVITDYESEIREFTVFQRTIKTQTGKARITKTYINKNGYRCFKDSHILLHRWIMEKNIGRKLNTLKLFSILMATN